LSSCRKWVVLSEIRGIKHVMCRIPGTKGSIEEAELLDGPTMSMYCELAKHERMWLSLGGFHGKLPDNPNKIANTHCIVDSNGEIVSSYRKIHLFDVDYDGGYKESDSTVPGSELVIVEDTPFGTIGVTTCYDLRFPEVYTILRNRGATLLLVPSAFMPTTGLAHWDVLLRARAIETQCYLVAAAQSGVHNQEIDSVRYRESYGHSLAVDPFGKVLVDLGKQNPGVEVIDLDYSYMEEVRQRMPIKSHRQTASIFKS